MALRSARRQNINCLLDSRDCLRRRWPLLAYGTLPGSESPTVLLAGNLDESNLSQRIAFPILMANIAEKLSPSPAPVTLSLGEPLTISPVRIGIGHHHQSRRGATTIPVPDAEGLPQGARQVAYGQTNAVGAYRLREADAQDQTLVTGMVMVNAGNGTRNRIFAPILIWAVCWTRRPELPKARRRMIWNPISGRCWRCWRSGF